MVRMVKRMPYQRSLKTRMLVEQRLQVKVVLAAMVDSSSSHLCVMKTMLSLMLKS